MESDLFKARMSYEEFQKRAQEESLTKYEKIGFPNSYRENKEENIFKDLYMKLKLDRKFIKILDIGSGCSDLVNYFINNAKNFHQELVLLDSEEMLSLIDYDTEFKKIPGKFPECFSLLEAYKDKLDVIVAYSVLQHVILDSNPYSFIDKALELLAPGAVLILGDLPNSSKRNRYFNSERGLKAHQEYVNSNDTPPPLVNFPDTYEKIDDGIILGILARYRGLGFETYLVPQAEDLPMANRREDILIYKN
jgi:2-polyprenyl-3-methyl-5-hydroxy-6-metoxy-1,4-benzoquinol methylase